MRRFPAIVSIALALTGVAGGCTSLTDGSDAEGLKFKEPDAKFYERVDHDRFPRGDGSSPPPAKKK